MWSTIVGIIQAIKALIDFIKFIRQWLKDEAKKADDKVAEEREQAAEKIREAKDEEEFNKASDHLHDRSN